MVELDVSFDGESHSADAIQRAAYRLSDRLSIELTTTEGVHRCRAWVATDDEGEAERVLHEFRNEVVDQVLRERIRAETADVRNVILSLAFSQTGLVAAEQ
jgi:His-Xaa-Ser system protein HxsD